MRRWAWYAVVGMAVVAAGCSDPAEPEPQPPPVAPELVSFGLTQALNPQLPTDLSGEIRGDTIRIVTPTVVPVQALVPTFATSDPDATVRIGQVAQSSGQTAVDFTAPVRYTVAGAGGTSRQYVVDVIVFTGLPVISITTDGGAPILNRENYVDATASVYGGKDQPGQSFTAPAQIRGRGNSTWSLSPKKPYRLRLRTSASMLGFPADRDWALLANYWDLTLARNALAFELSRRLGMAYTPRCAPVELILNGTHQGAYQVCDHQEVAPDRIPSGPGGWYLELTSVGRIEPDEVSFPTPQVSLFSQEWGTSEWVFKEPDEPTPAERAAIEGQMLRAEAVLYGDGFAHPDTGYAAHFDVESVIDWFLVMEIAKNNDAYFFNGVKIYRTASGKITFGPVWDFDLAFGQFGVDANPTGWRIRNAAWIERFFDDPTFQIQLKSRWQALYANRAQVDAWIQAYAQRVFLSQRLSHALWFPYAPRPTLRMGDALPETSIIRMPTRGAVFTDADYRTEVDALRSWLDTRWGWLHSNIMDL